jgi:hypothetical protein
MDWTDTRTTSCHKALIFWAKRRIIRHDARRSHDDPTDPHSHAECCGRGKGLNVAVSGSVIMFARTRQLAAAAAATTTAASPKHPNQ